MADVEVKVREIRRRTASFAVPIDKGRVLGGRINAKEVSISSNSGGTMYLPKTLAAVDTLASLVAAMRAELVEQGVEA